MKYDFLIQFQKRMKNVGLYTILSSNTRQKDIWKKYGFDTLDEQMNIVFSVLLYIMDQSLKSENCTLDDISLYIDVINSNYYRKEMGVADCNELADYIVNSILANDGRMMTFQGYNYENSVYEEIPISYIRNSAVYIDDTKRTSYSLTEDGYGFLLGTLEVENYMQLTIQELIFEKHLERQSYDKALVDIKNLFNKIQIQIQAIQEDMYRIRRNPLEYSESDYRELTIGNLDTVDEIAKKLKIHKKSVTDIVFELDHAGINVTALSKEDEEKLAYLKAIDNYIGRSLQEYHKILLKHYDLKALYNSELDKLLEMQLIKRISLRTDVFNKILDNPSSIAEIDSLLHPLFQKSPSKIFNLNRVLDPQKVTIEEPEENYVDIVDYDMKEWEKQQQEERNIKRKRYEGSLTILLSKISAKGTLTLSQLMNEMTAEEKMSLIPNTDIFKEIMVSLMHARYIDIDKMKAEIGEKSKEEESFHLGRMLIDMLEANTKWKKIKHFRITKAEHAKQVIIWQVTDPNGFEKSISCTDLKFEFMED